MPVSDESSKHIELLHLKVEQLLAQHHSNEEIKQELAKDGVEPGYAQTLIENVHYDKENKKSFRNSMIMGLFYIGAGLLINFFSYKIAATNNSFFFYLFWGILVLGIVTIIRGFILYK